MINLVISLIKLWTPVKANIYISDVVIPIFLELELHSIWKEPELELLELRNRFHT